jgi:singapore isolate B (sub-type 7) whole genome shotgun sequence assembly, scaffold_0
MNDPSVVQLAVYDLSRGIIKSYGSSLLGIDVEAIYHTGVRVYGYEYFFSNGIQKMTPEDVET